MYLVTLVIQMMQTMIIKVFIKHYCSRVWGHLEMPVIFKEKPAAFIFQFEKLREYILDIIKVVNDYSSWKWLICIVMCIKDNFQHPSLLNEQ